jgi:hypothetical protein
MPVFAKIKIGEIEGPDPGPGGETSGFYDVPVFYTNGNLYTQAFKLPVNEDDCIEIDVNGGELECCTDYTITQFYLYGENPLFGNPDYPDAPEFIIIKAAPLSGSDFQEFVDPDHALDLEFEVCAFEKVEIYIDVLCFIPDDFDLFGFFWFEITEITVREMCFFGDVCIDWWMYYYDDGECIPWVPIDFWTSTDPTTNLYQSQMQGIQADMPAIFELKLYKEDANGVFQLIKTANNEYYPPDFTQFWGGENNPLCIRYADYDFETDNFMLELYIYGPWGMTPAFGYELAHTWYFTDDAAPIDLYDDGVVEFAWGDCVQSPEYDFADNCTELGK